MSRPVRISSIDGKVSKTRIIDSATGKDIAGVVAFSLPRLDASSGFLTATIELLCDIDVAAQATFLVANPHTGKVEPVKSVTFESGETIEF